MCVLAIRCGFRFFSSPCSVSLCGSDERGLVGNDAHGKANGDTKDAGLLRA